MTPISSISKDFSDHVNNYVFPDEPQNLYDPVRYILSLGGKRIRPILVLVGYQLFKADYKRGFDAAMAVEIFHNFSLLHDDIMDNATTRRGQPSVHVKYDNNAAILSGDVMMIWCNKLLQSYKPELPDLLEHFTQTAIEVCEGQRMDMDFEVTGDVDIEDYIKMITLKTSVLLGLALRMGGIIAGASKQDQMHLYEFGKNLGIAFQIQDDVLDTLGEESKVGKRIGGDILQKKKTYLYLKALQLLSEKECEELRRLFSVSYVINHDDAHIAQVMNYFNASHVRVHAEELKLVYQQLAFSHLDALSVDNDKTQILKDFAEQLFHRDK